MRSSKGTLSYASLYLSGNTAGLNSAITTFSDLTEAGRTFTFALSAETSAVAGQRILSLTVDIGAERSQVPLTVNVLSNGFTLRLDTFSLSVYPGETVNLPVTLNSVNGYSGPVTLTADNLPQGVTVQPKTVSLAGNSVSTNLTLSASTNAQIAQSDFTVTARGGSIKLQQANKVVVYPHSILVPGVSYSYDIRSNVDNQSNLWLGGNSGFKKITSDLVSTVISSEKPPCDVTVGQDGGIWAKTEPYLRLDPVTGKIEHYSSPRGFSGCAGSYQFDGQRRAWETYFGIFRLDLVNQKSEKVPGTDNINGNLIVKDDKVWVTSNENLYTIDTDDLTLKKYSVPGAQIPYTFFPVGNKIYFVDNSQLASFDTASETVVRVNTGQWRIGKLYGLDKDGNSWVSAGIYTDTYRTAILRISPSGAVLKELPDLSNFSLTTAPKGGLWAVTSNGVDARVAYIAP